LPAKKKIQCDPAANPVVFNEPGLEAEVRKKLAKADGPISKDDVGKVKSVNLTQVPVDELDPCIFPLFKGVKDVFLGKGELTDLSPLASLNQLVSLRATGNQVADITPLTRMVHMDRLDLSHSQVNDITVLGNMTDLTELSLDDTPINDISILAKLTKLEKVSLRNTGVKDLKPLLACKKLQTLDVGGSPVEDTHVLDPLSSHGLKIKTS
ncbi:MAG TPA: leucine-rich repeat domain-containing protein, partial [Polyangiaceae bacterium]